MSGRELRRAVKESSIRFHNTQMSCMRNNSTDAMVLSPRKAEKVYRRQVMRPFDKHRATYLKEKRSRWLRLSSRKRSLASKKARSFEERTDRSVVDKHGRTVAYVVVSSSDI